MKLVKLRSNQELRKQGFTHAIRFNNIYPLVSLDDETEGGGSKYQSALDSLNKIYNGRNWRGHYFAWQADGRVLWKKDESGNTILEVITWIGVRSEAVALQVLLMI